MPIAPGNTPAATATIDALVLSAKAYTDQLRPRVSAWPVYAYGNSYALLTSPWLTTGSHYLQRAATALAAGAVTSYAVGGNRILNAIGGLLNETPFPNVVTANVAGSLWPGVSTRNGLVVLDSAFIDIAHYAISTGAAVPVAITTANTRYVDSVKSMYRHALALMSSQSRKEQLASGTVVYSGVWSAQANAYCSSGLVALTTAANAFVDITLTAAEIPQTGPLAGKVPISALKLDPSLGVMAKVTYSVDGGAGTDYTPSAWEMYTGPSGGNVNVASDCYTITVPVDGAGHTIRLQHTGAGGQAMYFDCALLPSEDPNPIIVLGSDLPPNAVTFNAAQVGIWKQNAALLTPIIRAAVAEFPNAIWVPSTMTAGGLYTLDGIHPNDRGQAQRASDLVNALQAIKPRLDSRALALSTDFTIL